MMESHLKSDSRRGMKLKKDKRISKFESTDNDSDCVNQNLNKNISKHNSRSGGHKQETPITSSPKKKSRAEYQRLYRQRFKEKNIPIESQKLDEQRKRKAANSKAYRDRKKRLREQGLLTQTQKLEEERIRKAANAKAYRERKKRLREEEILMQKYSTEELSVLQLQSEYPFELVMKLIHESRTSGPKEIEQIGQRTKIETPVSCIEQERWSNSSESSNCTMSCRNLTQNERSRIISLDATGYNYSQISRMTGLTRNTVRKWVLRNKNEGNIDPRPRKGRRLIEKGKQYFIPSTNEDKSTPGNVSNEELDDTPQCVRDVMQRAREMKGIGNVKQKEKQSVSSIPKHGIEIKSYQLGTKKGNRKNKGPTKSKIKDKTETTAEIVEIDRESVHTRRKLEVKDMVKSDVEKRPENNTAAVICTNCHEKIDGYRHICLECEDCLICDSCVLRNEHSLHYVTRLPLYKPPKDTEAVVDRLRHVLQKNRAPELAGSQDEVLNKKIDPDLLKQENEDASERQLLTTVPALEYQTSIPIKVKIEPYDSDDEALIISQEPHEDSGNEATVQPTTHSTQSFAKKRKLETKSSV